MDATLAETAVPPCPPPADSLTAFRPKLTFRARAGRFTVKTAEDGAELVRCLRLRHQVFHREWLGRELPGGLDADGFDPWADHILVLDEGSGEAIATYRVLHSELAPAFYSGVEFELDGLLSQPGSKLELGRACIAPAWRTGAALGLVWKGIARYVRLSGARWLFGCGTVRTEDWDGLALLLAGLDRDGLRRDEWGVRPKAAYAPPPRFPGAALDSSPAPQPVLPPLMQSYLRAGAWVEGRPAYDRDFRCADLLTVLDTERMSPRYAARFLKEGQE